MIVNRDMKIKDNVYSVEISFKNFGRPSLTDEEEKELLENYASKISYKDIDFKNYFKLDGKKVVEGSSGDGELVKIVLNDMNIKLDENFNAYFSINVDKISDSEVGTILNNKYLVAEAKCLLFESKICKAISDEIDNVVARNNDFKKTDEITL